MIHAVEQQQLGLFLLKRDDQICASDHFSVVQWIVIFILKFFPKSIVLLQCNFEYLKVASS